MDPGIKGADVSNYAGHYCEVPKRHEPGVLACTFILSGLRLFDIRDPFHPKEIAYFNGPAVPAPTSATGGTGNGANYAMSKPGLVAERGEIWYTDGHHGFSVVRITNGVWPFGGAAGSGLQEGPDWPPAGTDSEPGSSGGGGGSESGGSDEAVLDSARERPAGAPTPFTGAQIALFLLIAAAALGGGGVLLALQRHRR